MSYQIRPITPTELKDKPRDKPEFVFEAVNELLAEKYVSGRTCTIRQNEIKERIMSKTSQDFDWSWMDFEDIYRANGWNVNYDKPGYNESYEAYFEFRAK